MSDLDVEKLKEAKDKIESEFLGKGHAHSVYIGEVQREGQYTGEVGVVVLVDEKIPKAQLSSDEIIPSKVKVEGEVIPVDIQQAPQPTDLRLYIPEGFVYNSQADRAQAGENWQTCHDCPIPGGVQIAPAGAGWVGTLSCALSFVNSEGKRVVGAMTNYHVGVSQEQRGILQGQPSGSSGDWFAKLDRWSPMRPGQSNKVDAALLTTWRDDGKYAPGCHTVKPSQFRIGDINPDPVLTHSIGQAVQKSGRTTGHTLGKVTGILGTSNVSYGGSLGVLRFDGQTFIRGNSGEFSTSGDSGSLIMDMDRRPHSLLFAGGGGVTIANQIKEVIEMFDIKFIGMPA